MWVPRERVKPMVRANAKLVKAPKPHQCERWRQRPPLRALDLFCGRKKVKDLAHTKRSDQIISMAYPPRLGKILGQGRKRKGHGGIGELE